MISYIHNRILINIFLVPLVCGILHAQTTVEIVKRKGNYEVKSTFSTSAGMETSWRVLSDYENIPNYVSTVSYCKIVERNNDNILVDQKGRERVLYLFFVNINLRLKIKEEKDTIYYEDTLKTSFDTYKGYWQIKKLDTGTQVTNFLEAKPAFFVPGFIAKEYMKAKAKRYCEEILAEINRQAGVK